MVNFSGEEDVVEVEEIDVSPVTNGKSPAKSGK